MLGGGMRQSGILAAAGLHALEHHVARLAEDHRNAALLADLLRGIPELAVDGPHTNMVFVRIPADQIVPLAAFLKEWDILIMASARGRLVTHLGIDAAAIQQTAAAFLAFFHRQGGAGQAGQG